MSSNQIEGAETLTVAGSMDGGAARTAASPLPPSFTGTDEAVEHTAVHQMASAAAPEPELSGNGFTYRHNWGSRRGQWILRLNWSAINPVSRVLVAIGEGAGSGPDDGKFIGAARYTLHNVAPRAGGVDIWINIEWSSDIPLYVDYLIVNP